jgi:threonine dehydratase
MINKFTMWDVQKHVIEAEKRIKGFIRETPLEHDLFLSQWGDCHVFLKLENLQVTGSFKVRGAFNRLLSLTGEEKKKGIVTASTGNHGLAVTYALRKLGIRGKIFVPETIARAKLETLRLYGADLFFHGNDNVITEVYARKKAEENGQLFISPYNDAKIIGGQGTAAIELMKQTDKIHAVFVPVGGGGLMAGIAGFLKTMDRDIEIIGCQPEQSAVMFESVKAGRIIEMESKPTRSDGTAGGIEEGSITFSLCRDCVDEYILVSEAEIEDAIKLVLQKSNIMIEGAAALSVASFVKVKNRYKGKNVVLILSGRRLSYEALKEIICA